MVLIEHLEFDSAPLVENDVLPVQVREDVMAALRFVFGTEQATPIYRKVAEKVKTMRGKRSVDLLAEDFKRDAEWFREEIVYMFYAERFGVDADGKPNTFKSLIPLLDYLQELGVTALYILPFLASPMIDAGFDVSNYRTVREDLGGTEEFELFLVEAKRRGFRIKADLILNHISDQHEWFQAALQGDEEKLGYFVVRDTPPDVELAETVKEGKVAIYTEDDGQISQRRIMFPDISNTHYRRVTVTQGGETADKYFYHTFYPHQLDLNWLNPGVLLEAIDLLGFWANKGIDIFRLDAIPFFVKQPGTHGENLPQTHALIKVLSTCLQAMAPATVIQVEACQWPNDIRPYFGDEHHLTIQIPGHEDKNLQRTDEAQIAYHFPWMPAIWASMITEDPTAFWQATQDTPSIPPSASWAIFLRVHDELTLEMVEPSIRQLVYDKLVSRGESFRAGLGVSGRLANFLENDPRQIELIFSILFSLPGIPIIYFGDEIGEQNHLDFMQAQAREREERCSADKTVEVKSFVDSRDLGRAPIGRDRLFSAFKSNGLEGKVFQALQKLIRARRGDLVVAKGNIMRVGANDPNILCYIRSIKNESGHDISRLIIHNLSGEERTIKVSPPASFRPFSHGQCDLSDLLGNSNVCNLSSAPGGGLRVTMQPYQSFWLRSGAVI